MFFGRYDHTLDEKGRLTIPSRYRDLLGSSAVITRGFDKNLIVWPMDAFNKIYTSLQHGSLTDPSLRTLSRWLLSSAAQVEFDRTGRILVPSSLREMIHVDGNVVLVGMGGYFEIWTPELWAECESQMGDAEDNTQRWKEFHLTLE